MRCDTLTAVAAPEHGVFVCPLLGRDTAASALPSLANRCLQATGSGGRLSFWINGHTCPPTCRRHRRDEKKGKGRGLILGGWRPDYEWVDGSECLCRQTWLRLTDLRQVECDSGSISPAPVAVKQTSILNIRRASWLEITKYYSKTKYPQAKK